MPRWKVKLFGITWDDGKGEYDVSGLPPNVEMTVEGYAKRDAIEYAMREISELYGTLIEGTEQIEAKRV